MTTTAKQATKTRKPKQRSATVTLAGVLTLHEEGRPETSFWLTRLRSDFGSAWELAKFRAEGGEVYHVCLYPDGKHSTCECKGFLRWGPPLPPHQRPASADRLRPHAGLHPDVTLTPSEDLTVNPTHLTPLQREVLADVLRHTARTGDAAFRDTDVYSADTAKRRVLAYLCRLGMLERVSPHGEDVFLSRKGITAVRLAGLLDRDQERILVSCSWCSHLNDVTASRTNGTPTYCGACRHRTDLPRMGCDCPACSNPQQPRRLTEADVEEALRQLGVE